MLKLFQVLHDLEIFIQSQQVLQAALRFRLVRRALRVGQVFYDFLQFIEAPYLICSLVKVSVVFRAFVGTVAAEVSQRRSAVARRC